MQRHEEKIRATIKRNKKIITFTTLVGLICPATLGTIQALADETAPPTEQAEQVEQPVTEPVTPEQPIIETTSQEPVTPVLEVIEPEQTAPVEEVPEVVSSQTQPIDQTTTPVADMSVMEQQAQPRRVPGNEQEHIDKLQENWNKYLGLNQSDYTPESWAETTIGQQGWIGGYSPILLADPEMEVPLYSASLINQWWDWAFSVLVLADTPPIVISSELSGPTEVNAGETHKYSIKLTREDGTVAYEDIEGAAFILLGLDPSDEIDDVGNVTFGVTGTRNLSGQNFTGLTVTVKESTPPVQTGVFYDLVGDTSAKVGETKTYTYNEVKFFSDGSMTETPVNIEDTSFPLTSSDPSDVIVGGTITFGSEGTRTLVAKDNAGASLTVTVTKDSQEKTLTDIGFIPVIGMGVDGKLVPWSDFRVNLYYSDNTEEAVIPNSTDYAFTTDNPNDVITADGIIFNGVGNRVITVTHKEFTDKNGFVVVADQGLKEEDLKEAIKNGEDKISQGGWETTKDLEEAIQKGKDVLADENRTQEDIDNATKQINDEISKLKPKDNGNGGNGNNGDSNDNNQNGNNGANGGNQDGNNSNNANSGTNSNTGNNGSNKTNTTNVTNKSNQVSNNSSNKDNLPQTGDTTTNSLLAGLAMVGLSLVTLIKRKRKA